MFEPALEFAEARRFEAKEALGPFGAPMNELRFFEDLQVVRHGGLRKSEGSPEVGGCFLASRQFEHDGAARGIGEGRESGVEGLCCLHGGIALSRRQRRSGPGEPGPVKFKESLY